MSKQIKQQPFDGRAGEMRDSPWLASEDLHGLDAIDLEISNVFKSNDVEFEGGRKKDIVYSLEFKNAKRQLVLNGTNRKTMVALYGADVKGWIGKKITIYVEHNIKVGREFKDGLRLRATADQNKKASQKQKRPFILIDSRF